MSNQTDLHAAKAAEVLGKPVEEVTKEERRMGKAINFGLDYTIACTKHYPTALWANRHY